MNCVFANRCEEVVKGKGGFITLHIPLHSEDDTGNRTDSEFVDSALSEALKAIVMTKCIGPEKL